MRTCTIHFTDQPVGETDAHGTNLIKSGFKSGEYAVTWTLLDNSTADKFFQNTVALLNTPGRFLRWNTYGGQSLATLVDAINSELDYCTQQGYVPFDHSYRVSVNMPYDQRLTALNKIHFAFENELYYHQRNNTATDDFLVSLERLNRLVHSAERNNNQIDEERLYYVVRHNGPVQFPLAEDSDYERFQTNTATGDLFSDFWTVGKDLGTAFFTNDHELVSNQEVKQQSYISGAVNFDLVRNQFQQPHTPAQTAEIYQRYYAWCEQAAAQQHGYDFVLPQYRLGRAPVGLLEQISFDELYSNLVRYPFVCGIDVSE